MESDLKPFPIPVVALGAGVQIEDEQLDYLPMPKDMDTYRPPVLPEPQDIAGHTAAQEALHAVLELLDHAADGEPGGQISLQALSAGDRDLINQVLAEGEASAIVQDEAQPHLQTRIQESVFAGVWRVTRWDGETLLDDAIEVGPIPALLRQVAAEDVCPPPRWQGALPPNVQNAPLLVDEIRDHARHWRPGQPPHVVNLSLLPVSPEDIAFLDHELGTGRVLLLSRGYGNCRITNTRLPNCWRVVYYNSMDTVILNTVEVVDMPEVAMAAREDLRDSHNRLFDVAGYLVPA
ncbi:MAG: hydrogenase expression/formation protein [Burkholderiaceae bacterium]|jgi:hydrogenase-1 operon protein HyaF|nr:hydrogenase expression/formation protein [Burkholderiaceae bacterium]